MQKLVDDAGLSRLVTLDSAGTGSWHVGEQADVRTRQAARRRGLSITHRARQLVPADLSSFDLLIAIDRGHLAHLHAMLARHGGGAEVALLRSYDPTAGDHPDELDVPDPYYGGREDFERVIDLCEAACRGLLSQLAARLAR